MREVAFRSARTKFVVLRKVLHENDLFALSAKLQQDIDRDDVVEIDRQDVVAFAQIDKTRQSQLFAQLLHS